MFHLEKTLATGYELTAHKEISEKYNRKAILRMAAIHKYLWDKNEKTFVDYDFVNNKPTGRNTAAIVYPMFLKIATKEQGLHIVKKLENDFLKSGGLVTTLAFNKQQWDAPNGWAPIQWAGFKGSLNYSFDGFANKIKRNWISSIDNVFKATGKLTEKYNVIEREIAATGGEYPNQDGFGWTNGVYLKLKTFN